ncbi:nacht domain protein [Colletotrichum camelliae]|nr:nacht domain protein [Colletotrichum camelliae]
MSLSLPTSSSGASLVRRSPSPKGKSHPAAGLEIALAQFGANLTDDERKRLKDQECGLNDADAAFKFTLELDELDPVRRGRVAASKLCSLLQTVQIFGQVIDTYVSSNPQIAALIWGSLKLTFTTKIRPAVNDIRATAKQVKDAINFAKAQYDKLSQVEQEKTLNSLLEQSSKSTKRLSRLEQQNKSRAHAQKLEALLSKLSSYSYERAYKKARSKRHKGTAEWIFDAQEFKEWFLSEQNATLYLAGKIGSGKTILAAHIIDYVKRRQTARTFISFFLIRFDDINSQDPDTILRSIVRQALAYQSDNKASLDLLELSERSSFDSETLLDLLIEKIKSIEDFFIIIDGLDECGQQDQRVVLRTLAALLQRSEECRIKVLISARSSVKKQIDLLLPSTSRVTIGSENTDQDLLRYAEEILREKQEGDWGVGDQSLIDEILRAISLGGEGMFLWVFLTIEDICTRRSDDEIRKALSGIPRDLPETFNRVLERISLEGLSFYNTSSNSASNYPFLPYAKENWIYHTSDIRESSSTWRLWRKMDVFGEFAPWADSDWQPLGIARLEYDSSDPEITSRREKFFSIHQLDPITSGWRWFVMHKAIAYAKVLGNSALIAKLATYMLECEMPLDVLLLEELLQPRITHSPETPWKVLAEGHKRLIDLLAELLMRCNLLCPQFTRKSSFGSQETWASTCEDPCSLHGELQSFICYAFVGGYELHVRDNFFLSSFRLWSQLYTSNFNEEAFTIFKADYNTFCKMWAGQSRNRDGHHASILWDNEVFWILIDLGGKWSATILQWLLESSEEWQNEDVLRLLLDDKTWPTSDWVYHLKDCKSFDELSYPWLSRDLRHRLRGLVDLAAKHEKNKKKLHDAVVGHFWDVAADMERAGVRICATQNGDSAAESAFYEILLCNRLQHSRNAIFSTCFPTGALTASDDASVMLNCNGKAPPELWLHIEREEPESA